MYDIHLKENMIFSFTGDELHLENRLQDVRGKWEIEQ